KPDFVKALNCQTEAMKIFIDHRSESYFNTPFLFIDMGNVFYSLEYYEQARTLYRLAFNMVSDTTDYHPRQLSMLNIAFTYQEEHKPDSAFLYFQKSDDYILTRWHYLLAFNYNNQAEYLLELGRLNQVLPLLKKSLQLETKFAELKKDELLTNKVLSGSLNGTVIKTHELFYRYYYRLGMTDSSRVHFQEAMRIIRQGNVVNSRARMYLLDLLNNSGNIVKGYEEVYADSVIYLVSKKRNFHLMKVSSDSLSNYFNQQNNKVLSIKYQKIADEINSQLHELKTSKEVNEKAIFLANIFGHYTLLKKENDIKISQAALKRKNIMIAGITVSLLLLLVLAYRMLRRRDLTIKKFSEEIARYVKSGGKEWRQSTENRLANERKMALKHELEAIMEKNQPFLNPEFSVNDLAGMLLTNVKYASILINQEYGVNFHDFVNQLRVKYACHLLSDCANDHLSFIHIAEKSGFTSKSTFYRVFSKMMGMSPVAYRKTTHNTTSV
ncbi:MAG: helix-turn-helix domain-containing protein, partial [Mariniphaga sp.]